MVKKFKRKLKGLQLIAICGWCSKISQSPKIINPKEYGWVFLERYKGIKQNAWFCSHKCYANQINKWEGNSISSYFIDFLINIYDYVFRKNIKKVRVFKNA